MIQMDTIKVEEVIIATVLRRGAGVPGDPIRIITQVFTKSGELIAENDPCAGEVTIKGEDIIKEFRVSNRRNRF